MAAPLDLWWLDPAVTYLNHGSFGATPKCVLAAQDEWRRRMEAQPVRFMTRDLPQLLRNAAAQLADFLAADADGLVFVDNATTAVNTVLASLQLQAEDLVVIGSLAYPAVRNAAAYFCQRAGATLHTVQMPLEIDDPQQLIAPYINALRLRPRLMIVDHIISSTSWVLPIQSLIDQAHQENVLVLIDGAHAPGMYPLNLQALDVDWYTGNAHKWLFAPKGCAFLQTHPAHRATTHPLTISNFYQNGYIAEFDWIGTRDPSAWLAIGAALDFHLRLGGWTQVANNRSLAWASATAIAERCGLRLPAPACCYSSMISLPLGLDGDDSVAAALHDLLIDQYGFEVPVFALQQKIWLRISVQAYNSPDQYAFLADCVNGILQNLPRRIKTP